MKFGLTPGRILVIAIAAIIIDMAALLVFVFYPQVYSAEATTNDFRLLELRQLEAELRLEPLPTSPHQAGDRL